jgi:hypothetical protein
MIRLLLALGLSFGFNSVAAQSYWPQQGAPDAAAIQQEEQQEQSERQENDPGSQEANQIFNSYQHPSKQPPIRQDSAGNTEANRIFDSYQR